MGTRPSSDEGPRVIVAVLSKDSVSVGSSVKKVGGVSSGASVSVDDAKSLEAVTSKEVSVSV